MTVGGPRVHRCESAADAGREVAHRLLHHFEDSIEQGARIRLGVCGGRSIVPVLQALVVGADREQWRWRQWDLFLTDERAVPRGDAERNDALIEREFVVPLGASPVVLHRMAAEASDLEAAALDYDRQLAAPLHAVILGLGEDGHVASLFPGSPWLRESERRVGVVLDSPKPPARRLTLTSRAITETPLRLVLGFGAAKAAAVRRSLAIHGDVLETPARIARDGVWFVDAASAGG
ncbi:MAG: 6-phosphogluconolactonase [Candidatus Eisenbacteria bacterium]|uniref:6-phosphogluconolactonase n=1 Tax=Eiseniibacteriota bacterium TaxID=2212470 RepID=A0A849SET5_UNCEI|nr:6-phosphogluconolactonase [Candidatus Eisenbacteria bacterium]